MKTLSWLVAFTVSAVAFSTASGMDVTASPVPPSTDLLLWRDLGGDVGSYSCERGLGSEIDIGQTFRLGSESVLDRVTVRVRPENDVAGDAMILWFGTFSGPQDAEMDELLAVEIRALPSTLEPGELTYLTFDLADQELEADRQYGFVIGFSGGDHPGLPRLDVLHAGADTYPEGQAVRWIGLDEEALPTDLVFYLQGRSEGSTEPILLLGGRFEIRIDWWTSDQSGIGHPVRLTDLSAWFWFFDDANVEVVIKVLDACQDPWNRFWVFVSGMTNVGVRVVVTDLQTGLTHEYRNLAGGAFLPVLDTTTFATCDG